MRKRATNTHMTLRVPEPTKKEFVRMCTEHGSNASAEIKKFIEQRMREWQGSISQA